MSYLSDEENDTAAGASSTTSTDKIPPLYAPLMGIRPAKYVGVNIEKILPEFRPGGRLSFLKLMDRIRINRKTGYYHDMLMDLQKRRRERKMAEDEDSASKQSTIIRGNQIASSNDPPKRSLEVKGALPISTSISSKVTENEKQRSSEVDQSLTTEISAKEKEKAAEEIVCSKVLRPIPAKLGESDTVQVLKSEIERRNEKSKEERSISTDKPLQVCSFGGKRNAQNQLMETKRNEEKAIATVNSVQPQVEVSSDAEKRIKIKIRLPHPPLPISPIKMKRAIGRAPMREVKCGACGQIGHIRTSRNCPAFEFNKMQIPPPPPLYPAPVSLFPPIQVIKLEQEEKLDDNDRFPPVIKRRRTTTPRSKASSDCEQIITKKKVNRLRIDPVVAIGEIFERILSEVRKLDVAENFVQPVSKLYSASFAREYYKIVKTPMDLQTMLEKNRQGKYQLRTEFLGDIQQIRDNCGLKNGESSFFTYAANELLRCTTARVNSQAEELDKLEKMINPLLADDQNALNFILQRCIEELIGLFESRHFVKPVSLKNSRYHSIIKTPMCLDKMVVKIKESQYKSGKDFMADVNLISDNALLYNGADSILAKNGNRLASVANDFLSRYNDHVSMLEENIRETGQVGVEQDTGKLDLWNDNLLSQIKTENTEADVSNQLQPFGVEEKRASPQAAYQGGSRSNEELHYNRFSLSQVKQEVEEYDKMDMEGFPHASNSVSKNNPDNWSGGHDKRNYGVLSQPSNLCLSTIKVEAITSPLKDIVDEDLFLSDSDDDEKFGVISF